MPQKLVVCEHCQGTKICKFEHGKSCEVCRTSVGVGRKGRPSAVRCSFCTGRGRIWMEVPEEPVAEPAAEAGAEPVAEAASDAPADAPSEG